MKNVSRINWKYKKYYARIIMINGNRIFIQKQKRIQQKARNIMYYTYVLAVTTRLYQSYNYHLIELYKNIYITNNMVFRQGFLKLTIE